MNLWTTSPTKAFNIQNKLQKKVIIKDLSKKIETVAGADVSFNKYEKEVYAGIVVLSYPDLSLIEESAIQVDINFPYIPGLLSFREIPALLEAWKNLQNKPDVVMVDGHGIAHPRRMGIATHFGLVTQTPTLGVAKNKLYGTYTPPKITNVPEKLLDPSTGNHLGFVYVSKENTNPIFISPGHLMSCTDALVITQTCLKGYKLPEPTRQAHILANKFRLGKK